MNINLHDVVYNKDQWEITGSRISSYVVKNLTTYEEYKFLGDIIGIFQVSDTDFLVYRQIMIDKYQIVRYRCYNDKMEEKFTMFFSNLYTLSNHTILFDNYCVYDIKTNNIVEEFNQLPTKNFDVKFLKDYPNPVLLLKESVNAFYPKDYVFAYVDTTNFKIIKNQVYSTLRGGTVELSNKISFSEIVSEDKRYFKILQSIFFSSVEDIQNASSEFQNLIFSN